MTKVIIIGQQEPTQEKKPIEFVKAICEGRLITNYISPRIWGNIELVCRNYSNSGMDLMFAYDHTRNDGCLYLGHFNDGVV